MSRVKLFLSRSQPKFRSLTRFCKITGYLDHLNSIFSSWKTSAKVGLCLTIPTLLVSACVLIWGHSRELDPFTGDNVVFEGDCDSSASINTWSSGVINVTSALLLACSHSVVQILLAPTPANIESAHSRGKWLDIGIPSLTNWGSMGLWQTVVCISLITTSLPLSVL